MGNLIVTIGSIFVPLITDKVFIPYIYHPSRWGGVPWSEPGMFSGILKTILNISVIAILGTISGMMTTKKECNKTDVWLSLKRSTWPILGYLIGNIMITFLPILKAPLLMFFIWFPFASYLTHGFLVSLFVMFFGALGNGRIRLDLCD